MSLRSEWPCWEIMKCGADKACPAKENSQKMCWEIIREVDACSFNICRDCLVYVSKQKDSQFSQEEILSIMAQKGVSVLTGSKCPNFKKSEDS
ncbi:MAG: hypothetical protein ABFS19_00485 [Thermodesulfobacteriota bacterium]